MAKNLILWLVIAVVLMSVFQSFSPGETSGRQLDYTSFVHDVKQEQIREVRIEGQTVKGVKRSGERFTTFIPVTGSTASFRYHSRANDIPAATLGCSVDNGPW